MVGVNDTFGPVNTKPCIGRPEGRAEKPTDEFDRVTAGGEKVEEEEEEEEEEDVNGGCKSGLGWGEPEPGNGSENGCKKGRRGRRSR
ncbi:hypothetical protein HMI54_008442 [Coelomomyces lativittatus]|nr:hypothetical protein HMI54_008442 [Coelomomyces lativittatus]